MHEDQLVCMEKLEKSLNKLSKNVDERFAAREKIEKSLMEDLMKIVGQLRQQLSQRGEKTNDREEMITKMVELVTEIYLEVV